MTGDWQCVWLVYYYPVGKKRPTLLGVFTSQRLALQRVERLSDGFDVLIRRHQLDNVTGPSDA